ncbi:flagellar rod-binding protein FlgJ [Geotalea uraniireducens]|uniref:Flagellar rod-binding protein FlgJ n=1 Tax=Geotalea uraniireducens TaxID=351604 RepID=A0ABN6VVN9_9BACT|nr:rod-binding protein [Geotalea uraniireducens]BDV44440.1 flagellar rod-binding protein FlgJ [Geotalea uraniireducens]
MQTTLSNDILLQDNETSRARQLATTKDNTAKNRQAVKKVAQEFESIFIGMMLKSMRETVGKDPLTGGGHGEEVYRSLLDQEYANNIAKSGGLGLAPLIEQQMLRDGGVKAKNAPPALAPVTASTDGK